ncbi:hypothetical protein E2C01_100353 [Portunus trituberculatus]|uniref:Uncharacterized protein n=1 Tax=Portunus trituberculatus TaxID=210409 RepID=A0A5B7KJ98_PORTR|nr:hypothetical protein [Portunus trituberculatus]
MKRSRQRWIEGGKGRDGVAAGREGRPLDSHTNIDPLVAFLGAKGNDEDDQNDQDEQDEDAITTTLTSLSSRHHPHVNTASLTLH